MIKAIIRFSLILGCTNYLCIDQAFASGSQQAPSVTQQQEFTSHPGKHWFGSYEGSTDNLLHVLERIQSWLTANWDMSAIYKDCMNYLAGALNFGPSNPQYWYNIENIKRYVTRNGLCDVLRNAIKANEDRYNGIQHRDAFDSMMNALPTGDSQVDLDQYDTQTRSAQEGAGNLMHKVEAINNLKKALFDLVTNEKNASANYQQLIATINSQAAAVLTNQEFIEGYSDVITNFIKINGIFPCISKYVNAAALGSFMTTPQPAPQHVADFHAKLLQSMAEFQQTKLKKKTPNNNKQQKNRCAKYFNK